MTGQLVRRCAVEHHGTVLDIELLLVPDCPIEAAVVELVRAGLRATGVAASLRTTVITTQAEAQRRRFTGSPTILIDGQDPFAQPGAGVGIACRVYPTPGGMAGIPPQRDLDQALKRAADPGPH